MRFFFILYSTFPAAPFAMSVARDGHSVWMQTNVYYTTWNPSKLQKVKK